MKKNTNRPCRFSSFWGLFNMLSIDVAIGAILSGLFVQIIIPFNVNWVYWIILSLSVWIIYTADHLVDAYRLKANAHTDRHLFHYKNFRRILIAIVLLSMIVLNLVIFYLPTTVFYYGLGIGIFSLLYFFLLHVNKSSVFLQKEIIVAIIYTLGIWGVPLILNNFSIDLYRILLLFGFFILALADILLLSYFELDSDIKDNHVTWAVKFGKRKTKQMIRALLGIINIICVCLFVANSRELEKIAGIIYLLMATLIMGMISFPEKFEKQFLYRYLVEFVFWLPGLMLFFYTY
ncbi:MAG: hypothetical protein R2750_08310 [Bacteroidales bacterium]